MISTAGSGAEDIFSIGKILESVHRAGGGKKQSGSHGKIPGKDAPDSSAGGKTKACVERAGIYIRSGREEELRKKQRVRLLGVRRAGLWKKQFSVREKQRIQKKNCREREAGENGTPKQHREAWAAEKKKKHLFGKKQDKNIRKQTEKKARAEKM